MTLYDRAIFISPKAVFISLSREWHMPDDRFRRPFTFFFLRLSTMNDRARARGATTTHTRVRQLRRCAMTDELRHRNQHGRRQRQQQRHTHHFDFALEVVKIDLLLLFGPLGPLSPLAAILLFIFHRHVTVLAVDGVIGSLVLTTTTMRIVLQLNIRDTNIIVNAPRKNGGALCNHCTITKLKKLKSVSRVTCLSRALFPVIITNERFSIIPFK